MLAVLVSHYLFLRLDTKQFECAKPCPPRATRQDAALLRRLGHEAALFDAMLAAGTQDYDTRHQLLVNPQLGTGPGMRREVAVGLNDQRERLGAVSAEFDFGAQKGRAPAQRQ